jgi:peptide chain release factor 2
MSEPGFWDDRDGARKLAERAGSIRAELSTWDALLADAADAAELASSEDAAMSEVVQKEYERILGIFSTLEFATLFRGTHDERNVIVSIHAGSGGTEAQDWAEMLLRMYVRWCEQHAFAVRIVDETRGEVTGIKTVTLQVQGRWAYGYMRGEHGVHRLVRISPFDAEKMRHTSFALVEVVPELEAVEEQPIDAKDLRIDTFLASGHGGQSVNTTYSAVRIVHIPTGITVSCQNERSQLQNRETAMKILQAKLYRLAVIAQDAERETLRGAYQSAEWGSQIRSYVLQPYQLVKDHRTGYETADTAGVLNGDLDKFSEHYLQWVLEKKSKPL